MKLQQLRQFIGVAETLNFHRAAERLNIAQAPLSMAIRRLEEDLGTPLFERGSQGVTLTEAGKAALAPARDAVFFANEVRRLASLAHSGQTGKLTLHFVPSAMMAFLPRLIVEFRAARPDIELAVSESDSHSILERLEARELDVGIIRFPASIPRTLAFTPIHNDAYMAALPIDHPRARARKLRLRDLADDAFIMMSAQGNPSLHNSMKAACFRAGFDPRLGGTTGHVHTMLAMVQSKFGVCLLPSVCQRMAPPGVVLKPLADQTVGTTGLGLAHRQGPISPACQKLLDMAIATEADMQAPANQQADAAMAPALP